MPIRESRLRSGVLTLDGRAFATQATNVRLIPSTSDSGDTLEALSGDLILPDDTTSWQLSITAVQDFDDSAGFVAWSLANAGDTVAYEWRPNSTGVTYTGQVRVRPVEIGGDVNSRLTTDAEWPCQNAPTPTYPAVV